MLHIALSMSNSLSSQDVYPSVCLSVCPSHAGIATKRLNISSDFFLPPHHASLSTPNITARPPRIRERSCASASRLCERVSHVGFVDVGGPYLTHNCTDAHTNRQKKNRVTDRQTDRQTHKQSLDQKQQLAYPTDTETVTVVVKTMVTTTAHNRPTENYSRRSDVHTSSTSSKMRETATVWIITTTDADEKW